MRNQPLQYYIHDDFDALRFELAGSLSGSGAQSIQYAWKTALSIIGDRPLIVDITFVQDADEHGRLLLDLWRRSGARIIAASPKSRSIAAPYLDTSNPLMPSNQGWLNRLRGYLFGPSPAESRKTRRSSFAFTVTHTRSITPERV